MSVPGVREPQQRRSRRSFQRMVGAAESLLVEGGPEATTVQEIVSAADSSVGSFYTRFADRETVIRYVQDRFWARAEERWDDYFAKERRGDGSAAQILARLLRSLVRAMIADRRRYRAFVRLALGHRELGLDERIAALDERIARGAAALLAERAPSIPHADPVGAAGDAIRAALGAAREVLLFGPDTPAAHRRSILVLVQMVAAHLGLPDAPRSYPELLRLCAVATPPRTPHSRAMDEPIPGG